MSDLEIVIPEMDGELPVTEIGANAFVNEVYITDIVAGKDVNMFKEKMIYDT